MLSPSRIFAIVNKEFLVLFSRPLEKRIILIPPILMLFVFSYAATMDVHNVDLVVLNQDNGRWSEQLCARLLGSPTFRSITTVDSMEEARVAVEQQRALAILVFQNNFSKQIEAGNPATFQVLLDGRRSNAALIVQSYISGVAMNFATETPLAENMRKQQTATVQVEAVNWFNPNLVFAWFEVPNLMGLISMLMGFIITGLSVAREREMGTFDQMLVSPAELLEIAMAKLVPGAMVALFHGTIFVLGAYFYFRIPLEGSLLILYSGMIIFAISVSGIGLLISSFASTQQQAFLGCFTVAVPLILFSGFATPVRNMPLYLQYLAQLDPLRHFLVVIQGVFLKDMSLEASLIPLGKMALIGFVTTTLAILFFKKRV